MVYVVNRSVGASSSVSVEMLTAQKFITGCEVMFDDTAAWKCGVRTKEGKALFWPAQGSDPEWVSGEGGIQIRHDVHHRLETNGRVVVEMQNTDSGGAHTIEVRIHADWFSFRLAAMQLLDLLRKVLEKFSQGSPAEPDSSGKGTA
jgi:hypothetical protein